jgi:hypothetical protein
MILSSTSAQRSARADLLPTPAPTGGRAANTRLDQISTEGAAFLKAELGRQPAVRPEVVARARALLADPNYPSAHVLTKVAEQILNSPDLTEDVS